VMRDLIEKLSVIRDWYPTFASLYFTAAMFVCFGGVSIQSSTNVNETVSQITRE